MAIAAQRYADILTVIADSKISEEEVNLLAAKWNLTNYEVLKYIAKVTGNVNLGSGWDAAGLAAADGWKTALKELNAYLAAVGKGAFIAPQYVPGGVTTPPVAQDLVDQMVKEFTKPEVIPNPTTTQPDYMEYRRGERGDAPRPLLNTQLPDYRDYRMGERASYNIIVNNAGSTITQSDLQESIRSGLLAGQTSGRSITARVLDL